MERFGLDLTTDAWVAVDATGTVVAYGQVTRDETDVAASWGVVHPAHRARGVGSALFGRIEARAIDLMAGVHGARFRHAVNADDEAAAAMLMSRGLRLVRHFWHMRIQLSPESSSWVRRLRGSPSRSSGRKMTCERSTASSTMPSRTTGGTNRSRSSTGPGTGPKAQDDDPSRRRWAWGPPAGRSPHRGRARRPGLGDVARNTQGRARGRGIGGALLQRTFEAFAARRGPLGRAGRGRGQPYWSHRPLRAGGHARGQALRPVGAAGRSWDRRRRWCSRRRRSVILAAQ